MARDDAAASRNRCGFIGRRLRPNYPTVNKS
jgi:hypothetical protein